jgi:hypothetical protein
MTPILAKVTAIEKLGDQYGSGANFIKCMFLGCSLFSVDSFI